MKTKKKVALGFIAAIIALLAFFAVIFFNSPEYMLIKLYIDVEENGSDAMYKYMTDDFAKQIKYLDELSQSGFGMFLKQQLDDIRYFKLFENAEITLERTEHKKDGATAFVTVNSNDKPKFSAEIYIVKTDSGWKIDGFGNVTEIK